MRQDPALADLVARAAEYLSLEPPGDGAPTANPRGDHDLDGADTAVVPERPHRRAAVLVPVLPRADGTQVL